MAIIGISGRYPGAENLAHYWENLKSGQDSIGELPADPWPRRL
ncbi:beta-ketoacyl synthase N-terminal-like domain-containing protein, partial [Lactobacillus crispatus]